MNVTNVLCLLKNIFRYERFNEIIIYRVQRTGREIKYGNWRTYTRKRVVLRAKSFNNEPLQVIKRFWQCIQKPHVVIQILTKYGNGKYCGFIHLETLENIIHHLKHIVWYSGLCVLFFMIDNDSLAAGKLLLPLLQQSR